MSIVPVAILGPIMGDFQAVYLGTMPVNKPTGVDTCAAAYKRLTGLSQPERPVRMIISPMGIHILEADRDEIVKITPLADVSFISLDAQDKKICSYITHNRAIDSMFCDVFRANKRAKDIPVAVNLAVAKAYASPSAFPPPPQEMPPAKTYAATIAASSKDEKKKKKEEPASVEDNDDESDKLEFVEFESMGFTKDPATEPWNFEAQYVGTLAVDENKGNETIESAIAHFEAQKATPDPIMLVISSESIQIVDIASEGVASTDCIRHVVHSSVLPQDDKTFFAYVVAHPLTGIVTCTVLQCEGFSSFEIGDAMVDALNLAHSSESPFETIFHKDNAYREDSSVAVPGAEQISRERLSPISLIDTGKFGNVYLAYQQMLSGVPALVSVTVLPSDASAAVLREFMQEKTMHVGLKHANVIALMGLSLRNRPWLAIHEAAKFGDLKTMLGSLQLQKIGTSTREQCNIARQVCAGLDFLADKSLVHTFESGVFSTIFEINIGLQECELSACVWVQAVNAASGSAALSSPLKLALKWQAPEVLKDNTISEKSAVWSFGVMLWELSSGGETPFANMTSADAKTAIIGGSKLAKPAACASALFGVMGKCWAPAPANRPTFKQLQELVVTLEAVVKGESQRDLGELAQSKTAGLNTVLAKPATVVPPPPLPSPVDEPWFQPEVTTDTAAEMAVLANRPGDFIVSTFVPKAKSGANSGSPPVPSGPPSYVLTVNDGGKGALHFRVRVRGSFFVIGGHFFHALQGIVGFLQRTPFRGTFTGHALRLGVAAKAPSPLAARPSIRSGVVANGYNGDDDLGRGSPLTRGSSMRSSGSSSSLGAAKDRWYAPRRQTVKECAAAVAQNGRHGDFLVCPATDPTQFVLCLNDGGKAAKYVLEVLPSGDVVVQGVSRKHPSVAAVVEFGRRTGFTGNATGAMVYLASPLPGGELSPGGAAAAASEPVEEVFGF